MNDRVPVGWQAAIEADPHEEVLRRNGFDYRGRFAFPIRHTWTVGNLIGLAYSRSFLNRAVLGDEIEAFERSLANRLSNHGAEGIFEKSGTFACELARAPS